jgi:hypothetical protein
MVCVPPLSEVVEKTAEPETRVAEPSTVAPSLNVTVPDGVNTEETLGLTVAVKLTCWPKIDELVEEESVVVVVVAPGGMIAIPNADLGPTGITAMEACVLTSNTCTFPLGARPLS